MKVLFAVNNENISESIIKKYQKEYKEIITYKNVYYFNAILKELQKDKTYDRIVISEDLEPFANNNYDIIDKFLFEKLDRISDEATDLNGNDIPIILICTDRRSKSDGLLIKLFGIGIYSAIIGKDRSIDEVCRLISMPRTKKEGKLYYKIESEEVNYQTENESDVSEVEIQNILMHYKRLGKNTERYVDSFNNIASQYTDAQLKIIAKFLPLNVKAVLESESTIYQELMMASTTGNKGKGRAGNDLKKGKNARENLKPDDISFDAFNTKEENTLFSKPIVIPSNLNTKKHVKLTNQEPEHVKPEIQGPKIKKQQIEPIEAFEEEVKQIEPERAKRGRGRPRKIVETESEPIQEAVVQPVKRGRGRPKKIQEPIDIDELLVEEENVIPDIPPIYQEPKEKETVNLFELDEDEEYEDNTSISIDREIYNNSNYSNNSNMQMQSIDKKTSNYTTEKALVSGEGKIVSFVGTNKNGTSFIVNNLADVLSSMGAKTAILDATKNKNSYYIYTKNDEQLRLQANNSIYNLEQGIVGGIAVNRNLTVYTAVPGEKKEEDIIKVLDTLSREYSVILVDCDFETDEKIFENSKEIYLVQSMDILTIQPMTAFLRELKNKGILDSEKLRVIVNKYEKIRNITPKVIIGGMAYYNDPSMSFMTELFNKDNIQNIVLPLDLEVYLRYLESLVTCEISTKGYTKNFMTALNTLASMVYPLLNRRETRGTKTKYKGFSSDMDQTLNKMKKNY